MAEISTPQNSTPKKTSAKKSIRIDMTPMVDLGFLLITFFMFAASFSKPNIIDLGLPGKTDKPTNDNVIGIENQVTFILGKENRVFYYQQEIDELTSEDFREVSLEGMEIAKLIQKLKQSASKPEIFTVIIKPTDESTYKNFVDMMDEMQLSRHEIYGVTDLKPKEQELYKGLIP